ncbi:unnamed protein product [Gordionus sp. m RMFG-2023]
MIPLRIKREQKFWGKLINHFWGQPDKSWGYLQTTKHRTEYFSGYKSVLPLPSLEVYNDALTKEDSGKKDYFASELSHYPDNNLRANTKVSFHGLRKSFIESPTMDDKMSERESKIFDIDLPLCKIPHLDPFDKSIRAYLEASKNSSLEAAINECPLLDGEEKREPDLTRLVNGTILIDGKVLENYRKRRKIRGNLLCTWAAIFRDYEGGRPDMEIVYEPELTHEFFNNVSGKISAEFVRVICYDVGDIEKRILYANVHTNDMGNGGASGSEEGEEKGHRGNGNLFTEPSKVSNKPNVLMIGIDSTSRLNFLRSMDKVRSYLNRVAKERTFLFKGYIKLGDNTFPNLIALTLGKLVTDFPSGDLGKTEPLDRHDFIWKRYKSRGYTTMYLEDGSEMSTFSYLRKGFNRTPTDYYFRPFSMSMRRMHQGGSHCFTKLEEVRTLFKYAQNVIVNSIKRRQPYFGMAFTSRVTHQNIYNLKMVDEIVFRFLKNLHVEGMLENTFVFIFGDHGLRFGHFRKTFTGMMEERLPLLYLLTPKDFRTKYPDYYKNLESNRARITTPLDVHRTLLDILDMADEGLGERIYLARKSGDFDSSHVGNQAKPAVSGIPGHSYNKMVDPYLLSAKNAYSGFPRGKRKRYSLFQAIPRSRGCQNASIPIEFCPCNVIGNDGASNDILFANAAQALMMKLRDILANYKELCRPLVLKGIHSAVIFTSNTTLMQEIYSSSANSDPLSTSPKKRKRPGNIFNLKLDGVKDPNVKRELRLLLVVRVRPSQALFEAMIGYDPGKDSYTNILGSISRINKYENQSFCITDDHEIQKFCLCRKKKRNRVHLYKWM